MIFLKRAKLILPIVMGNILEWYEFSLYGALAPFISHQIFTDQTPSKALLQTFSILAVSYFIRPIGAIFFGFLADKVGRKKTLPLTIGLMAFSTTCIGLIPPHSWIGGWSAVLLILFRLLQGIATGGEYANSLVYLIEQSPKEQRGFWGAIFCAGGYLGFFLGYSISTGITHLTQNTIYEENAWRLPFISGMTLAFLGFYIRQKMPETPSFLIAKEKGTLVKNPLLDVIQFHYKGILIGIGITILPAVLSYLILTYLPTFLSLHGKVPLQTALLFNMITTFFAILILPLFGFLSDRLGRFPFLLGSAVLLIFLSPLLFQMFLSQDLFTILGALILFVTLLSAIEGLIPATLMNLFSVKERCSGVALSLNIAYGCFGGTAPLLASLLIAQSPAAPGLYIMLIAFLSMLTILLGHKKIKQL